MGVAWDNVRRIACAVIIGLSVAAAGCRDHDDDHHDGGGGGHDDDVDLRDDGSWDQWADDTAIPGDRFEAGLDVRNVGDDDAGGFWVDFYLSDNSTITSSDRRIGSVYVGWLDEDEDTDVDLDVTFPDGIPPGRYYIGVIIDATDRIDETNESNNTVVFSGDMVVVEDEFEENDGLDDAYYLGSWGTTYTLEAVISTSGDTDWFAVWQSDGYSINIDLTSLPDDYDLLLVDDDGNLIADSTSGGTTAESIVHIATYTGMYYIVVVPDGSAADEDDTYLLEIELP